MASVREKFSNDEINSVLSDTKGNITKAARILSRKSGVVVSRQLLSYWISTMDSTELSIDPPVMTRELVRARNLGVSNNELRKQVRALSDRVQVLADYRDLLKDIQIITPNKQPITVVPTATKSDVIIEVLFSDLQIGKLSDNYNTTIAKDRVVQWAEQVQARIKDVQRTYNVIGIKLAFLGDIIESDKKHANSGRACDIGTAEQMQIATELISNVILILSRYAPTTVIMVTGNHDHDGRGLVPYMAGQEHLSWSMYNAIKLICNAANPSINFIIPRGCFYVDSIFSSNILYEHGVGVHCNEASMVNRANQRSHQVNKLIHLSRMGDKHNICRFNDDKHVVNGAFFGGDTIGSEYSSALGYHSYPAQIMFVHKDDTKVNIVESYVVKFN